MATPLMVINPRRRRRGRRKKARSSHRRRRRTVRVSASINPRRRRRRRINRRAHARRGHRRRRHSNPRVPGLGGIVPTIKTAGGIAIGVFGAEIATAAAIKYIPGIPEQLKSGTGRLATKALVAGVAAPMVLKMLKQGGLARNVAIGAWVAILGDVLNTYVAPHLGLAGYEAGISGYELPAGINDLNPDEVGAAENMYGDTMYGYGG